MTYYKKKGKPYRRSEEGTLYMNLHPYCEACGNWQSEELHHILSRRSGGPDEDWNWLALCKACHLVFHTVGRYSFTLRYPACEEKIKAACATMGRKFNKWE